MSTSLTWEFQSIPIDFEVFKALTARLESPHDSFNGVLRRLLDIPEPTRHTRRSLVVNAVTPWTVDGVSFPQGTEFRAKYKGRIHSGVVDRGALVVNGVRFRSPSPAAISITGTTINGWKFWECRRPGTAAWVSIDGLRSR